MQVPVPLVIVKSAPVFVHAPDEPYVIAFPDPPPVAATVKPFPYVALDGAWVEIWIAWSAFFPFTVSVSCGAAL